MEAVPSSQMLASFYQTTQCQIVEDSKYSANVCLHVRRYKRGIISSITMSDRGGWVFLYWIKCLILLFVQKRKIKWHKLKKILYRKKSSFQGILFNFGFHLDVTLLVSEWEKATFILLGNKQEFIRIRIIQIISFSIKA
jgi:hypothetical protein